MARARTRRRRNRQPRWSLRKPTSARVRPRSIRPDRLPARCHAGGVRRDGRDGAGAARHWQADRRGPCRAVRRLRPRRLRRPRRSAPSTASPATRGASPSSRGAAPSRGSPTAAPASAPLAAVAVCLRLRRARRCRRHRRSVLRSPRFRPRIRFRCRTARRRHRLPRPAAGRRQPAPPAAPWRLPACAPVRRGR